MFGTCAEYQECVFKNEEIVRDMKPDQNLLMKIEGRIQNATVRGKDADCVCPVLYRGERQRAAL